MRKNVTESFSAYQSLIELISSGGETQIRRNIYGQKDIRTKNQHTRDQRDFENPYFNTTFENNSIALFNEMFAYFGITRGLSENCDGFSFLNPFSTQKRDQS